MEILYLDHNNIDKKKWDDCIRTSLNGIVYGYSWYLDIVSENWAALISGDYETVMPLTWKRKFGMDYLVQPVYSQQLGIFSTHRLSKDLVNSFITNIPAKYKFIDIKLNIFNHADVFGFEYFTNTNYELDLISEYKDLKEKYSENTRRNISKAINNGITVVEGVTANDLINLFRTEVGDPKNKFSEIEYNKLRQIIAYARRYGSGEIYGAYTGNNSLCAATFFIRSNRKAIYLVSVSDSFGKESSAMFLIVDEFIRRNSGKNFILDFEGSNIEGVARFFKGFGSTRCEYLSVTKNNLPFLFKLLKSIR